MASMAIATLKGLVSVAVGQPAVSRSCFCVVRTVTLVRMDNFLTWTRLQGCCQHSLRPLRSLQSQFRTLGFAQNHRASAKTFGLVSQMIAVPGGPH